MNVFVFFAFLSSCLAFPGHGQQAQTLDFPKYERAPRGAARSPCPMLNSLANHGILPRNGRMISKDMLNYALSEYVKLDTIAVRGLIIAAFQQSANGTFLNLDELNTYISFLSLINPNQCSHNEIEHDASLSRKDAYFGDQVRFDAETYDQIYTFTTDGYMSLEQLKNYRRFRENQSRNFNPHFKWGEKQQGAAYLEASILYNIFKEWKYGTLKVEWMDVLFKEERLPVREGWIARPVSSLQVLKTATKLRF